MKEIMILQRPQSNSVGLVSIIYKYTIFPQKSNTNAFILKNCKDEGNESYYSKSKKRFDAKSLKFQILFSSFEN